MFDNKESLKARKLMLKGVIFVIITGETSELEHSSIKNTMTFKRYVFDPEKKLVQ